MKHDIDEMHQTMNDRIATLRFYDEEGDTVFECKLPLGTLGVEFQTHAGDVVSEVCLDEATGFVLSLLFDGQATWEMDRE
jgi:hypothetical protein